MRAWEQFLVQQEKELGRDTIDKWLRPLKVVNFDACNLYLEAKDSFQVLWFEEHIREKVQAKFFNNNKKKIKVHLSLPDSTLKEEKGKKKAKAPANFPLQAKFALNFDLLDPHATLENFVVDENNVLAQKLLNKIIHNTSELATFNPVYIYGRAGTGKTHLLMATANALKSKGLNVIYTRAETFTEHVVTAIRAGEMSVFRQAYRNSDILIIDDVHIFSRKNATQEELFHTFNTLHVGGKQIILGSNCAPAELQMIEPRLVSRFEWGIVLPLEPLKRPDIQKALEHKMSAFQFHLSPKVLDFLQEHFPSGIKAITRALQALILRSHLNKDKQASSLDLTLTQVEYLLNDLIEEEKKSKITPTKIIQSVAEYFGIKSEDILGKAQTRECVLPRQLSMYLCRKNLKLPFLKIGDLFSKDHSTVMSSVKAVQKSLDSNDKDILIPFSAVLKKLEES